ncbi:MAG: sensor domain-containing diguanylate cyclase [Candidatus Rokubacteria bacterium]|nr:sensor domain-containing diguanylate cyclase [Candidatus Rokubacteria bacterium]
MPRSVDLTQAYHELVQIGLALSRETDLGILLDRILTEARRFTRAEAGTLYLLEGDTLHFAVVQNDLLTLRLGEEEMRRCLQAEPLRLNEPSLAGHVALTGDILNLHDPHMIPPDRPYGFNPQVDARCDYRTQSVLVVPLQDPSGKILGVLQLINALDKHRRVVPFDSHYENLVRSLALQAATAIRNTRLETLALKDGLTEGYNRRYLLARLHEECQRYARSSEPVSLVLVNLDRFKAINDLLGTNAGDEVLKDVARLLLKHSRSFTVVSRFGGDEFAALLVNTPKGGALAYARRIREVIAEHTFGHGKLTASLGVASLPDDAAVAEELLRAADEALRRAKRAGRNRVTAR